YCCQYVYFSTNYYTYCHSLWNIYLLWTKTVKMEICIPFLLAFIAFYEVEAAIDCDTLGTIIYEDIGCRPVTKEGQNCPVKYDCDTVPRNNTCMFRGRTLSVGQQVDNDLTYDSCNVGCHCRNTGKFECAVLDCPEWLGIHPGPGCYKTYDVNKCCSVGKNCHSAKQTIGECVVDNEKYLEGQKFYPDNTCLKCVCPKEFNGKLEAPHCKRTRCSSQIRHSQDIANNCAPYYDTTKDGVICCPDAWVCPTPTDKIITVNPNADKSSDLTCKFGDKTLKLGEGLESKVNYYDGSTKKARCECILPPLLTCRQII
ncbi:unnamed protein product, partial [Phaedon cochleariae]